jgi:NADH-quinone oxidoreductase subunit I
MRGYLGSTVHALATSLTNLFRRPVTVEFPKVIRPRAERYRSSFALLHEEDGDEACIGCLQCERICPSEVISIKFGGKRESPISGKKRGYADDFVLDLNACIYCELCVQVCPTDAIVMTREPELPAYGREDLVLTMAKLYANEKSKPRAWGDATRLNAMQVPPKPPRAEPAAAAPPATPAAAAAPPKPGPIPSAAAPAPPSSATPASTDAPAPAVALPAVAPAPPSSATPASTDAPAPAVAPPAASTPAASSPVSSSTDPGEEGK